MWLTPRGLLKGTWPIILFGLAAILAAIGTTQYVAEQGPVPMDQPRSYYIKGTDIEIRRVHDDQAGLCFIVVEGSGAFQVECTPRFKDLAGGIQDRAQRGGISSRYWEIMDTNVIGEQPRGGNHEGGKG